MREWVERFWYGIGAWHFLLWPILLPLSLLFRVLVWARRKAYALGILPSWRAPVPVLIVGNITVGGTGKTPLCLWLAQFLIRQGFTPGLVSRGYGGSARRPEAVTLSSKAAEVGDEPLLLARRSGCPVWVGRSRPLAVRHLLDAHPDCNVVICDDGLQHYALARDVEIAVGDGRRHLGNGMLLPAGPLREPAGRLREVDAVVMHRGEASRGEFGMRLVPTAFRNLAQPERIAEVKDFHQKRLHAVAGIGQPQRFFDQLAEMGLQVQTHAFPDHHPYIPEELSFDGADAILMTEKDAVKCQPFAKPHWWYLEVEAQISDALGQLVLNALRSRDGRQTV